MNPEISRLLIRLAARPDSLAQELAHQLELAINRAEMLERENRAYQQYKEVMEKHKRQGAQATP